MHKVTVWHCDYCRKTYTGKGAMAAHENVCSYNPASHSCATCVYLKYKPVQVGFSGGVPIMREAPYCSIGKIRDEERTQRNPDGLRRNCPSHEPDKYK